MDPGVLSAKKVSDGPADVGAVFLLDLWFGGPVIRMKYRIVEMVDNTRLVLAGQAPASKRWTPYRFPRSTGARGSLTGPT